MSIYYLDTQSACHQCILLYHCQSVLSLGFEEGRIKSKKNWPWASHRIYPMRGRVWEGGIPLLLGGLQLQKIFQF